LITPIKNKNFYHIEYAEFPEDQIVIFYYSNQMDELNGDEIFAGICTDFYIGDGIEDALYSDTLTLKDAHQLTEQNHWKRLQEYGRWSSQETKFATRRIPVRDIQIERKSNEQEILEKLGQKNEDYPVDNDLENNSNQKNNLKINDFLIFTPRDPKMSLDDAMKLWINSGTNNF
jgi:hypothetical protein